MDLIRLTVLAAIIDTTSLPDVHADAVTMRTILSTIFVILGAAAVVVITLAGFTYTISHGDPKVIEQAKNAIFYAVIGLIVAVLAYAIVNFVLVNL